MLGEEATAAAAGFWSKAAELGWAGLRVPEEREGLGSGVFDLAVLFEEAGRRLIPGELFASGVLAVETLVKLGSADAQASYLPGIAEGRIRATLALSEPGERWALRVPSGPECVKTLVPNAAGADLLLAVVRTAEDRVELRRVQQATIESLATLDPTRRLDQVRFDLTSAETIGSGSLADLKEALAVATIALAAEMVGGAQELLDMNGRVRQAAQAIWRSRRRLSGGAASGGRHAGAHREGAVGGALRRPPCR